MCIKMIATNITESTNVQETNTSLHKIEQKNDFQEYNIKYHGGI